MMQKFKRSQMSIKRFHSMKSQNESFSEQVKLREQDKQQSSAKTVALRKLKVSKVRHTRHTITCKVPNSSVKLVSAKLFHALQQGSRPDQLKRTAETDRRLFLIRWGQRDWAAPGKQEKRHWRWHWNWKSQLRRGGSEPPKGVKKGTKWGSEGEGKKEEEWDTDRHWRRHTHRINGETMCQRRRSKTEAEATKEIFLKWDRTRFVPRWQ